MSTINRYLKDTIRSCYWELCLTEFDNGTYELWSGHRVKDTGDMKKETTKMISEKKAMKFKLDNAIYLIECYQVKN